MSQPPWDQPAPPWGQQQPYPSQQPYPPQQGWGRPPVRSGGTALLVLGLLAAVLGLVGAVLPSVHYADGLGSSGPLVQSFGDTTQFLVSGLVLVAAVVLLVVGAVVQRTRALVGTGIVLVGGGMVADAGVGQLFGLLQAAVVGDQTSVGVGGVLLSLAGCVAVAVVVVGLLALPRLR